MTITEDLDHHSEEFSYSSLARLALAETIVKSVPEALAVEAAIVGSASFGVADDHSDLDVDLWIDEPELDSIIRRRVEELF